MVKAIVANGCYRTTDVMTMPSKGDILLYRADDGTVSHIYKVCGHRPTASAILANPLAFARDALGGCYYWDSQVSLGYNRRNDTGEFYLHQSALKKMIPADLPNAPVAMPPPMVAVRDRVVETPCVPPHMKEHIKELIGFGKEFECPVCFDTIRADTIHITKCGHFFCEGCVRSLPYRSIASNHKSCPVCRADI